MGWLAESVEFAADSPEACARAVAEWIKSSVGEVTNAVEDLTSQGEFDEEMLEEIEENTSVTVYISAACPQQELKAELAHLNREDTQVVWLGEQA
jgi:hypothetical protein